MNWESDGALPKGGLQFWTRSVDDRGLMWSPLWLAQSFQRRYWGKGDGACVDTGLL